MPKCIRIKRKKRQICLGDLDSLITLENRNIQAPEFDTVDFDEVFTEAIPDVWAMIETVRGKTFFDGVNTEKDITHLIYIMFDLTVTAETWVKFNDGRRFDILDVENLDERSQFMLLHCQDKGTKEAGKS